MSILNRSIIPLVAFSGVLLTLGCGGTVEGEYPVTPASGSVKYQGQPVPDARVIFYPADTDKPAATAITDEAGNYELTTYNPSDGAVAGSYTVTIRKTEDVDIGDEPIDPREGQKMRSKSLIPPQYGIPTESRLTATVTEGGSNEFPFDLK